MAGKSSGGGFADVLSRLVSEVAQAMTLPDADLQFCQHMIQMLVARARAQGQGQMGGAGGLPQGGMGGPQMGGGRPPLQAVPGQVNTPSPMPPVGELQRLMGAQAGAA